MRNPLRAHQELRSLREEVIRLRTARARARQRVDRLQTRLQRTRERAREDRVVLEQVTLERDHVQDGARQLQGWLDEHEQRLARGGGALFDYTYQPRPRDFGRGRPSRFDTLVGEGDDRYADLVGRLAKHAGPLAAISLEEPEDPREPFWSNAWFPPLDGATLYLMVAEHHPRTYLEVGSGNSTKYVRRAIRDHGLSTRIVSIDPEPRAEVNELCDEVVRQRFEDVDLALLDQLGPGDMMFVDNSHRGFTASDVTVFFTEALPSLKPGVLWGLHDTFLPHDYPAEWNDRFYNEQYYLMCYLLGGGDGDRIELPVHYLESRRDLAQPLLEVWPEALPGGDDFRGGCFWLRRGGAGA